ncbi:MAG: PilZ domain-containing protein [Candidatus Omnitrophota bacterium]
MSNYIEKRRYRRIGVRVPIQYKELHGKPNAQKGALSKNISEGGVKFNTDKFISLACRMLVEVNLPTEPKPIKAISKVAWIRKLPAGDDYEVGNQFLDMTKTDKSTITEYVKGYMGEDGESADL